MVHSLEPILAQLPFFEGLEQSHLQLLVGCASNARYFAEEYLYREGQDANRFFIIRQGKVAIEMAVPGRGIVTLQTHDAGDVVGWAWLLPPYRWHFSARATELTRVISLDGVCLRHKCEQDARLGYEFLKRFSAKTERALELLYLQMVDLYAAPAQRETRSAHAPARIPA